VSVTETDKLVVLPNGAVVAFDETPNAGSTAMGFFMRVGSRNEARHEWGAAHLLEHLAFKGAGPWTAAAVADRMDRLGGDINAFTTRDLTCYYAHVLDEDAPEAFDLLWQLVTAPRLTEEDFERERGVVREEMRDALNDAEDRAEQAYMQALWGRHPVSHDVLGSPTSLDEMTWATIRRFWRTHYHPANLVVVWVGRPSPAVRDRVVDRIAAWPPAAGVRVLRPPKPVGGFRRVPVAGDQVFVMLGWPAPPRGQRAEHATRILTLALGGQNSSRLWQRLREQSGLAYYVGASYQPQHDYADLALSCGVAPDTIERAVAEMGQEWGTLVRQGLSAAEVERAQQQLRRNLVFGLETPEGRMHHVARWVMDGYAPPALPELLKDMEAVGLDDVHRVLAELAASPHFAFGASGPEDALSRRLADIFLNEAEG
jgi:predicted Zn-dependent peptidase